MHHARLRFQDGAEVLIPVEKGQTVLDGAMGADAPLRYDCCAGSCGSCVVQRLRGSVDIDRSGALPITEQEINEGLVPTCLARLNSDAEFLLPYAAQPAPSPPGRQGALVTAINPLAANVVQLKLSLDAPDDFRFMPGQYLRLRPPGQRVTRAYSIASTPEALPELELLIRLVPGGLMSDWLQTTAAIGDRVTIYGPMGAFALQPVSHRQVFVAGGTGLAPVVSMLRALRGSDRQALLCFGCTRPQELFYREELRQLQTEMPDLDLRISVIEDPSAELLNGTSVDQLRSGDTDADTTAYLCGPPAMITAARTRLLELGLSVEAIRAERFLPSG